MLMAVVAIGAPAIAQDPTTYPVNLEVRDGRLAFTRESSCEGDRNPGDVCVRGGAAAEIVFTLGRGSEDWALSEILIRDPAANWQTRLPDRTRDEFPQFNRYGVLRAAGDGQGSMVVSFSNRHELAVQYGVIARNRSSGEQLAPAHAVIDSDGGTAFSGE